jgi:hypothetical protein
MAESNKLIKSITGFIKDHLKTVNVQPEIKIDFDPSFISDDYRLALRETWNDILKEVDENPQIVLKRKWNNYEWNWERNEDIDIKEDNIVLKLTSPKYPMVGSKSLNANEPIKTQVQTSEDSLSAMLPNFLHNLALATPEKKRAVYISVSAAVRGEVTDDELVRKVADDVMQRLVLKKLTD